MGFFSSPADKYSKIEHPFPDERIKRIFDHLRMANLTSGEEDIVEEAIKARKGHDGKISLRQIYETIHHLKNENKISKIDEHGLMDLFVEHFQEFDK